MSIYQTWFAAPPSCFGINVLHGSVSIGPTNHYSITLYFGITNQSVVITNKKEEYDDDDDDDDDEESIRSE